MFPVMQIGPLAIQITGLILLLGLWLGLALAERHATEFGVAALIYGQRKGMKLLPTLDALTPVLAVLAIAVSAAHLASGSAFGAPTPLPWGIHLWGETRHPTQVYEILAYIILLIVFWPGRKAIHKWPPGNYFLAFTGSSASLYLFLQTFRGDSPVLINGLRIPQIIAWLVLAFCLAAIGKLSKRNFEDNKIR